MEFKKTYLFFTAATVKSGADGADGESGDAGPTGDAGPIGADVNDVEELYYMNLTAVAPAPEEISGTIQASGEVQDNIYITDNGDRDFFRADAEMDNVAEGYYVDLTEVTKTPIKFHPTITDQNRNRQRRFSCTCYFDM